MLDGAPSDVFARVGPRCIVVVLDSSPEVLGHRRVKSLCEDAREYLVVAEELGLGHGGHDHLLDVCVPHAVVIGRLVPI